jgi:hypothetical protein
MEEYWVTRFMRTKHISDSWWDSLLAYRDRVFILCIQNLFETFPCCVQQMPVMSKNHKQGDVY